MRGLLAGLVIAILVIVVALLGAALAAFGIAAIGWLLHRTFDLTQWQASLLTLAVMSGLAYLVFRLIAVPAGPSIWDADLGPWQETVEDSAEPDEPEPPIVPWRRQRPTPGQLPSQSSNARRAKRK
ncbi:MAG: hypothetical protein BWY52_02378 [Chloroflexi bacterium ADurb.Bin325]|nr:MAG: hypothetical protein BWY52_02378 [Chloroflexi bacterium ADurb.Bin325]